MKFKIDKKIFETNQEITIGCVVVSGFSNTKKNDEIFQFLEDSIKSIHDRFSDYDKIESFFSSWHEQFNTIKISSENMISVESLVSRICKGSKLPNISAVVDLYNAFSLKYLLPLGGHDLDKIRGDIKLGYLEKDMPFTEMGSKDNVLIEKGNVCYYDEEKVLTRDWGVRQSEFDKIDLDTKNIFIPIDGITKEDSENIKKLISEIKVLFPYYLGGDIQIFVLDKDNLEVDLPDLSSDFSPHLKTEEEIKVENLVNRSIENVYPSKSFLKRLLLTKKISIYLGIDPTGPTLHLGHAISLMKLKQFQELGHKVVLLIGDFTAQIGDPTDKDATRQPLTHEEVINNCKKYKKQASYLLNFEGKNPAKFVYNSDWLKKLNFEDVINLSSNFTVQQMLERDMFSNRMKEGKPISLHEFFYPLMQGYDSVALDIDGEIGGNDQTFNMLAGRTLMKKMRNSKDKFVMTVKILADTNGQKMGKTTGNMITLEDKPDQIYGSVMSWTDGMILPGLELCTDVSMDKIEKIKTAMDSGENPRDAKMLLAREIIKNYHSEKEAVNSEQNFINMFQKKETPVNVEEYKLNNDTLLIDLLIDSNLLTSRADAKRLCDQNAIKIDDEVVNDIFMDIPKGKSFVLKVGKKKFLKVL